MAKMESSGWELEYIKGSVPYIGRDGTPQRLQSVLAEIRAESAEVDAMWERYPVQRGECWRVGDATFLCGDIMDTQVAQALTDMLDTERFIVYSSPPWREGTVSGLRDAIDLPACDFEDFVIAWTNLVMDADAIYLETTTTLAFRENLYCSTLTVCGQSLQHAYALTYEDQGCLLGHFVPIDTEGTDSIPGIHGVARLQAPGLILHNYEPTRVFDPFMSIGFGLTARAAVNNGHTFIGCDVRPQCMAVALAGQERIIRNAPERIA